MKAARIHDFGGPEVLVYEDAPRPTPEDDQVLIKVEVASVNPVDGKIRAGEFKRFHPHLPAILGRDVAGVIEAVGAAVKDFQVGDAVFGMLAYERGTYAEYAVALPNEIARKPVQLEAERAAGIGVAGLTAWQAVMERGELQRGQRVVIHGGGGGVGHFAVQFAIAQGAEVIATASPQDVEFVRGLGVEKVIDYKAQRFEEEVREVDLVIDLIAGQTRERSWQLLKPGGLIVSTLGEPKPPADAPPGMRGREVVVEVNAEQLAEIADRAASGKLRIEVDKRYPLAETRRAHEHMENEHARGKTVLLIRS
jgi:NADPH:quinone reductase-like Zn-dependent oxidoreductase